MRGMECMQQIICLDDNLRITAVDKGTEERLASSSYVLHCVCLPVLTVDLVCTTVQQYVDPRSRRIKQLLHACLVYRVCVDDLW